MQLLVHFKDSSVLEHWEFVQIVSLEKKREEKELMSWRGGLKTSGKAVVQPVEQFDCRQYFQRLAPIGWVGGERSRVVVPIEKSTLDEVSSGYFMCVVQGKYEQRGAYTDERRCSGAISRAFKLTVAFAPWRGGWNQGSFMGRTRDREFHMQSILQCIKRASQSWVEKLQLHVIQPCKTRRSRLCLQLSIPSFFGTQQ